MHAFLSHLPLNFLVSKRIDCHFSVLFYCVVYLEGCLVLNVLHMQLLSLDT